MKKLIVLCVEDEAEVRDAVIRDLAPFKSTVRIEAAESVDDANAVLEDAKASDQDIALILCDHLMPGTHGVDFLIKLQGESEYKPTRKVLITGQAGLEDTVRAVNEAELHHYIAKPWKAATLQEVVRTQLTEYVLKTQDDLTPYVATLDGARLLEAIASRGRDA